MAVLNKRYDGEISRGMKFRVLLFFRILEILCALGSAACIYAMCAVFVSCIYHAAILLFVVAILLTYSVTILEEVIKRIKNQVKVKNES